MNRLFVFVLIGVMVVFIGCSQDSHVARPTPSSTSSNNTKQVERDLDGPLAIRGSDVVQGAGEILLIEFSDYECPFCKRFQKTVHELVANGEVMRVYRHLPLDFHETAREGAVIAECVRMHSGSNAFWSYTDNVYAMESLNLEVYKALGKQVGLSGAQIEVCLKSGSAAQNRVDQHLQDAEDLEVRGTPTAFLVNRKTGETEVVHGAQPIAEVRKKISAIR